MKKYNRYNLPPWLQNIRSLLKQFIIPFCVFQGIRTFFIPTTIDILLLAILILIAVALKYEFL